MRVLSPKKAELLLNTKDWRILQEVVQKVRQPLSTIAKRTLLSRQAVEYRLELMKKNSLITGSRAVIDIQKLGFHSYHSFIEVHTPDEEKIIVERAQRLPFVNAIIKYSGKYNLEISIVARNPQEFLGYYEQLINTARIRDDQILMLLQTICAQVLPRTHFPQLKDIYEAGFGEALKKSRIKPVTEIDETDLCILLSLSRDALKTNIALAQEAGVSKDTVVYRLKRLEQEGYLREYRPIINFSVLGLSINSVLIKLNYSQNSAQEFEHYLQRHGLILWAVRTFGYFDYLVYVITKNMDEFHGVMNGIKESFQDRIKTYEILFAYEQLKYEYMTESMMTKKSKQ